MTTTFNRLASASILRTINLIITIVISFFMMPFLIHNLGDETYGLWVLIGSLMGYYMVVDFGLLSATQRFLAKHLDNSDELSEVINTSFCVLSIMSCFAFVLTVGLWSIADSLITNQSFVPTLETLILILGLKTILTLPFMVFNGMLSAKLRFDIASYIEIGKNIIRTALVILYVTQDYGIITLAIITLLTELAAFMVIFFCAYKIYPEAKYGLKHYNSSTAKNLFQFGKYTFLSETSNLLKFKVDDVVISKFIGLAAITTYAVAFSLFNYAGQFISNLVGGLVTIFTTNIKHGNQALRSKLLLFTEICTLVATYFSVMMLLLGNSFITLWVGDGYAESYDVLFIFCFILLITASTRVCVPLIYALAVHKRLAYWNLIEGVLNLIISIILAQKYGVIGVAIGSLIPSILFRLYFQISYACKLIELPIFSFWKVLIRHWLFGGVFFIVVSHYKSVFDIQSFFDFFIAGAVLSVVFVFIACRLMLSDSVKNTLKQNLENKLPPALIRITLG